MALVAVIALAGVTAVIGVTVGAVTVRSLETTNGVAASVEARAAAQAGIAHAENELRELTGAGDGACPSGATLEPGDVGALGVDFLVEIFSDNGSGGWSAVPTCPSPDTVRIKVISTGFAERSVSASRAGEDEVQLEATFQYIPRYVEIPIIDPAVYAYSIDDVLKKFVLDSSDNNVAADLQIKIGDFECSNGARVAGDVILGDGYADLTDCDITGTLHATEYAHIKSGSDVSGNVIATGTSVANSDDVVRVSAGSEVDGSVFAGGNVSVLSSSASRVFGNVTATRNSTTRVVVANSSTVSGNVTSSGTIQRNGTISGTPSEGVTGLSVPPPAQVANWTDIPFDDAMAADLAAGGTATTWGQEGFTIRTWSGDCTISGLDPLWTEINLALTKTVFDARACVGGVNILNNLGIDLLLKADIAIIADSFRFEKLSADSFFPLEKRKLYFIVPDNTPDMQPTCDGESGDFEMVNEANLLPTVSAFIYTPCEIESDRDGWRGQYYGGSIVFNQQAQMTFVPSSPPGIDFTNGVPPMLVLDGAYLGDQISIREIVS